MYQSLLEGLEITIIDKSQIIEDNSEFRIDTEYYKEEYLRLYEKLIETPILNDLVNMSDLSTNGSFATVAEIIHDDNPKVIPFIRSGNAGDTFINQSELEFISKEAHEKLPKSTTQLHDIMMARKGKIGGASIIMPEEVNFNCNENVIKLDIIDKEKINPFYFTTFFNCKYGLKQVERLATGNVQPWVSIFQIRKLKLFVPTSNFQKEIEKIIVQSYRKIHDSKNLYQAAENLLLTELGIDEKIFQVAGNEVVVNEVMFADFENSWRLDAEYYQPKYDYIQERLTENGYVSLADISVLRKGIQARSIVENGVLYASIKDCYGHTINTTEYTDTEELVLVEPNEIVIAVTGATIGKTAINNTNINIAISGDLVAIKPSTNTPEYILVVLSSPFIQEYCKRYTTGATNGHFNITDVKTLPIPNINQKIQDKITLKVRESFNLKTQSEALLNKAKRAVEMAIESGEEAAMAYILAD